MQVTVLYFAVLREQRGLSSETLETSATTPATLYQELQTKYPFSIPATSLRCAINDDFAPMDHRLSENDTVAFIAPVAGG